MAIYNLGNYIRARRYVKALIEEYPDFRCDAARRRLRRSGEEPGALLLSSKGRRRGEALRFGALPALARPRSKLVKRAESMRKGATSLVMRRSRRCAPPSPQPHRQAQALSVECDDMVLRDGLIGVGLVGGVVGLIALVAGAAGSRRR